MANSRFFQANGQPIPATALDNELATVDTRLTNAESRLTALEKINAANTTTPGAQPTPAPVVTPTPATPPAAKPAS